MTVLYIINVFLEAFASAEKGAPRHESFGNMNTLKCHSEKSVCISLIYFGFSCWLSFIGTFDPGNIEHEIMFNNDYVLRIDHFMMWPTISWMIVLFHESTPLCIKTGTHHFCMLCAQKLFYRCITGHDYFFGLLIVSLFLSLLFNLQYILLYRPLAYPVGTFELELFCWLILNVLNNRLNGDLDRVLYVTSLYLCHG